MDKLYILASDYNKREKTLVLYAAEVNKETGELAGEWQTVTSWEKEEKSDVVQYRAGYNADSSRMVLVSSIQGKEQNNYAVKQFNDKLTQIGKEVTISNEFDPKTYKLEDVVYTDNDNIVLVGREFEYQEGKKKKDKYLDFKNYNIRVYSNTGKQIKQLNTTIDGNWLMSTKVAQIPSREIVLAAFYSKEKRGKEINGILVQRIDPRTGDVISTSQKDIDVSQISTVESDGATGDDEEDKAEKREREKFEKMQNEEEGFSKYFRFRNFIYTEDKGLVVIAEACNSYTHTTSSYSPGFNGSPGRYTTYTYNVYECGDVMMSKINAAGKVDWLHALPKQQREVSAVGSGSSSTGLSVQSYFIPGLNLPFYAGFGVVTNGNLINIIFNDHPKNANVLQLGQKVQRAGTFNRSDCFSVTLNALTGKYTRAKLFSNKDNPTAMPRLGSVLQKDMYLIGKEDRIFGKSKIAVAKLTIKN